MFRLTIRLKSDPRYSRPGGTFSSLNSARTGRQNLALAAAFTLLVAIMLPINSAEAGVGLSVTPTFPTTVTVGDEDVPASLDIVNASTPDENTAPITITSIRLTPSCSDPFDVGCDDPGSIADPAAFTISPTATGAAGTACEGRTFTTSTNPTTGEVTFTPVGDPIVLQPPSLATDQDTCVINFTFDVNKVPNHDASPGAPGIQTAQVGFVSAISQLNNLPGSGTGTDITTVLAAPTQIVTQATPTAEVGTPIQDTATLSGGVNPTGTITFELYGPNDPTCAGPPIFTSNVPVAGNGDYTSTPPFTPTAPGDYNWVATYSGDANNLGSTSPCGAPNETTVVTQAGPELATVASEDVTLGGQIFDTATLSTGFNPTGTITFTAYGPNDADCTTPIFTSTVPVSGNGNYTSEPFTPTAPGNYQWIAAYSGDANNAPAITACNDPAEQVVVNQVTPTIVTVASPSVPVGGQITDTATLAGGTNPTGTITFQLFGPDDDTCAGPAIFTSTVPVDGNGDYTSAPFTVSSPGTYRWIAAYSGDANNAAVTTACNDPNESVVVSQAGPTIVTVASPNTTIGNPVTDTATLEGGFNPTGTITFELYGPNDANCEGDAIFTSTVEVNGNGDYTSAPFTPTAPGTYRWTAAYSGDANNAAVTSPCNAPNEQVVVSQQVPTIVTNVNPATANLNQPVTDTATLSGGLNPTGTITFTAFGPDNENCTGAPIYTSVVPVNGNGDYTSTPPFVPTQPGTYRFVAIYSGDANNGAATSPCNAPNEIVTVLGGPIIDVVKTVSPSSRPAPGGDFTFSVVVTNTGPVPLVITELQDNIYGDLGDPANPNITDNTCDDLIGDTLQPGESTEPCSFVGEFTGVPGASQTDVVTVTGVDQAGNEVTADDDAVVVLTPPTLTIQVDKTASPLSRPAPGGDFTFTVVVTNTSAVPLTITSLNDDVYGDLGDPANPNITDNNCDDLVGDTLQPGTSSPPCSFTGEFTGPAGASQTDIVTVVGTDQFGGTATDNDDAVVTITPLAPPQIAVVKTVDPAVRFVPGGDFTFSVVVTNPGTTPITITSLTDDIYGNIGDPARPNNTCDDLIGDVLAPGASTAPCSFVGAFNSPTPASQTDVVTVVGVDAAGTTVTDNDDAVVTLIPRPVPQIRVDKTATPGSRPAPGGVFTFTVVVSNPGPVPVVITTLTDDIYGNLGDPANPNVTDNTCDDLIGDTVAPGASTAPCSFTAEFTGAANASQTDIVTVVGVDELGTTVTDDDDAVVTLTPAPPGPISIVVDKTATPGSRLEPGGTFTFNVVITNTSDVRLTITSLTDDIYGNLATRTGVNTCDDLIGDVLEPGASTSCSFEGQFTGNAGDTQTDVVTVVGRADDGRTTDDDDDAEVELTDVLPRIEVVKTATPLQRTAPGGSFTFKIEVTNPGTEDLVLIELVDDVYGDLNGRGTCATGGTIEPGETYTCEFSVEFTGSDGDSQTDTVTATGQDDEGNEVEDIDDAVIKLVAPPPASPTVSPPPTVRPAPPPPPAAPRPQAPSVLSRTGGELLPFFALALALIAGGMVLRSSGPAFDAGRPAGRPRRRPNRRR